MSKLSKQEAAALRETLEGNTVREGECLIWRGTVKSGYPILNKRSVRRRLWEAERGPIPKGKRLGCSCGDPLCIARAHTILRNYAEGMTGPANYNSARRSAMVTKVARSRPATKLNMEKAREIRASDKSTRVLSEEYGISRWAVRLIKRGEIWREAANGASVFSWGGLAA